MSQPVQDDWVLDEAEALLDMDDRRERLDQVVADLQSGKVQPVDQATARDRVVERMASTGFNYGRLTSKGILWYFPTPKLGLFYLDDGRTLTVVDVVDARRLRRLP